MNWALLALFAFICVFNTSVLADTFATVDKNFDGKIDRAEFNSYVHSLNVAIEPFVDIATSEKSPIIDSESREAWLKEMTEETSADFIPSLINSFAMIIVTELGDKTFFIAAILAMKNGRLVVYLGAMSALAFMHVLSSLLGIALPSVLSRTYTHYACALLFLYFGGKLLHDAYEMESNGGPSEELQEVEDELINKKDDIEQQQSIEGEAYEKTDKPAAEMTVVSAFVQALNNVQSKLGLQFRQCLFQFQILESHENLDVFTQAFMLTFLAEWGDRSQIATIALASVKNAYGVVFGGLVGHALCTGLAVVGGRMLAAKISERAVSILGGCCFLAFGIHSVYVGP